MLASRLMPRKKKIHDLKKSYFNQTTCLIDDGPIL